MGSWSREGPSTPLRNATARCVHPHAEYRKVRRHAGAGRVSKTRRGALPTPQAARVGELVRRPHVAVFGSRGFAEAIRLCGHTARCPAAYSLATRINNTDAGAAVRKANQFGQGARAGVARSEMGGPSEIFLRGLDDGSACLV